MSYPPSASLLSLSQSVALQSSLSPLSHSFSPSPVRSYRKFFVISWYFSGKQGVHQVAFLMNCSNGGSAIVFRDIFLLCLGVGVSGGRERRERTGMGGGGGKMAERRKGR